MQYTKVTVTRNLFPLVYCLCAWVPLLAQQGEVHKQISGGWNTKARSNAKKVLTQPTESW